MHVQLLSPNVKTPRIHSAQFRGCISHYYLMQVRHSQSPQSHSSSGHRGLLHSSSAAISAKASRATLLVRDDAGYSIPENRQSWPIPLRPVHIYCIHAGGTLRIVTSTVLCSKCINLSASASTQSKVAYLSQRNSYYTMAHCTSRISRVLLPCKSSTEPMHALLSASKNISQSRKHNDAHQCMLARYTDASNRSTNHPCIRSSIHASTHPSIQVLFSFCPAPM